MYEKGIEKPRQIASLDGLRALSIAMVVVLHTVQHASLAHHMPLWLYVLGDGWMGVFIFFIISGYLITTLLLREEDKRGRISLKSFYLRRAFRILPPLYLYILVIAVLAAIGRMPGFTRLDLWTALTLTRNYSPASLWAFEHFWSLCIEEQFYLLWPGVLVFCLSRRPGIEGRKLAARVALAVIVVEPFVRLLLFHFARGAANTSAFYMSADPLMFGALGALLQRTRRFEAAYHRITRWPALLPVVVLLVLGTLDVRFQNYWRLPIGMTVDGVFVLMWLLWLTRNRDSMQGKLFNNAAVMWVGRLSYSIYIWQTLFIHWKNASVFGGERVWNVFPGSWVCIVAVAAASYYLVEQPSLRLRDVFLRKMRWHEI